MSIILNLVKRINNEDDYRRYYEELTPLQFIPAVDYRVSLGSDIIMLLESGKFDEAKRFTEAKGKELGKDYLDFLYYEAQAEKRHQEEQMIEEIIKEERFRELEEEKERTRKLRKETGSIYNLTTNPSFDIFEENEFNNY